MPAEPSADCWRCVEEKFQIRVQKYMACSNCDSRPSWTDLVPIGFGDLGGWVAWEREQKVKRSQVSNVRFARTCKDRNNSFQLVCKPLETEQITLSRLQGVCWNHRGHGQPPVFVRESCGLDRVPALCHANRRRFAERSRMHLTSPLQLHWERSRAAQSIVTTVTKVAFRDIHEVKGQRN